MEIKFGKLTIGQNSPCLIVAEAANCHDGSLETAKKMARAAKGAGADVVKFQLLLPEQMIHYYEPKEIYEKHIAALKRMSLSLDEHKQLKEYCEQIGIEYLCTPFTPESVDMLGSIGVRGIKIGSGEMTCAPIVRRSVALAKKRGIPIFISSGMSTQEEMKQTTQYLKNEGVAFILVHCISEYPQKHADTNLRLIPHYSNTYQVPIGFSDHTMDAYTAFAAVALGAKFVEKHFTLDRSQDNNDHFFSLEPAAFADLVQGIRRVESALGDAKQIHAREAATRQVAHHSVTSVGNLKKGTILSEANTTVKRPSGGIPASDYYNILGEKINRDITDNQAIQRGDLA